MAEMTRSLNWTNLFEGGAEGSLKNREKEQERCRIGKLDGRCEPTKQTDKHDLLKKVD